MSNPSKSYLIVGSGVFGASTAYHLSKAYPQASITLVDRVLPFPSPQGASNDENKIIRADYGSPFYCELALKARQAWENDMLYKPYYHQSGMVNLRDSNGRTIIKNYENLGVQHQCEIVEPGELASRYNGLFADADYEGINDIFINPQSGWAEATKALRNVVEAAIQNGVYCVQGNVLRLVFDTRGACTGVQLNVGTNQAPVAGNVLSADTIILSTGAGTAKLLAESAPDRAELQAGERITAAAVVTGFVKLTQKQIERFKDSPIFIHGGEKVLGQVLPPTPDGILKFCVDVSFKNTSFHQESGQMISAPPDQPDQGQNKVPQSLKDECSRVVKGIYGKELGDFQFEWFRICWDGFTPNQDFIISAHPHSSNLYIATGGSFHGWKFLPVLGEYVVQLLDGKLEEDFVKRWAWDRPQEGAAHDKIRPRREMGDL